MQQQTRFSYGRPHLPTVVMSPTPGAEAYNNQQTYYATEETSFVCSILKEKYKVLTSVDGVHENVIVIKPPLVFTREDAALFVSCFEKALLVDLPSAKDLVGNFGRTPT